ncbi:hypothetical protein BDV98DRAFT_551854 [Pterulicium gracile]|uniref:UBX domain-containing protein n=1 Tax=Pterulicium gracile TaxID=1884261 RepID=A0A5C3QBN4_9AGAR|nr:hypothetical protein BDV98DRAFT_551854 [Pterula gracilis]
MSDNADTQPTAIPSNSPPPAQSTSYVVYKPPVNLSSPVPNLPDSFFTPTSSDLKSAQATLSSRTRNLNDSPLQLRASREAALQARAEKYPNTTLRIRFTDRTQLEKTFPSTDKIRSVYAFVRNLLREDVKPIKFILYQSPPKRDLKVSDPAVRDLNLYELQLAPSSVLLLRFEDDKLNSSTYPAPLVDSAISEAVELPRPPEFPVAPSPAPNSGSGASTSKLTGDSSAEAKEKKISKFFKLPGKK